MNDGLPSRGDETDSVSTHSVVVIGTVIRLSNLHLSKAAGREFMKEVTVVQCNRDSFDLHEGRD